MKNYYDILGVSPSADEDSIKQAYRKLSQKLHPDKNDSDTLFVEMFKNINEAYSTLGDKIKREQYDRLVFNNKVNNYTSAEVREHVELDSLYLDAIVIILVHKQASPVLVQRKLQLGYNRAGRTMDGLTALGLVSESIGDARTILVTKQGAVDLLSKKVNNFSVSEFHAKYDKYEKLVGPQLVSCQTPNHKSNLSSSAPKKTVKRPYSIWDDVRRWERIKNTMKFINVCLFLYFLVGPKVSILKSITSFHYYTTGRVITEKGLNLREGPNSNAKIITSIPYYENVDISGEIGPSETIAGNTDNWIEVEYDGNKGWAWGGFVER